MWTITHCSGLNHLGLWVNAEPDSLDFEDGASGTKEMRCRQIRQRLRRLLGPAPP